MSKAEWVNKQSFSCCCSCDEPGEAITVVPLGAVDHLIEALIEANKHIEKLGRELDTITGRL